METPPVYRMEVTSSAAPDDGLIDGTTAVEGAEGAEQGEKGDRGEKGDMTAAVAGADEMFALCFRLAGPLARVRLLSEKGQWARATPLGDQRPGHWSTQLAQIMAVRDGPASVASEREHEELGVDMDEGFL